MSTEAASRRGVPDAPVARLPGYLRALTALADAGAASGSPHELSTPPGACLF